MRHEIEVAAKWWADQLRETPNHDNGDGVKRGSSFVFDAAVVDTMPNFQSVDSRHVYVDLFLKGLPITTDWSKTVENKCDCCGKFRKIYELVTMEGDSNGGYSGEQWVECMYCMSKSDFDQYSQFLKISNMHKELDAIVAKRNLR